MENCAQCRNVFARIVKSAFVFLCKVQKLHFENILCCRFAHFVHDGFSHICRFAHLCFASLQKSFAHVNSFLRICTNINFFFAKTHTCKISLRACFSLFDGFCQICSKSRKSRNFRKCPKMSRRFLTCSRKCPKKAHVFLSGTRVVPGPTRLTTQGGKSRQNMH